MKGRKQQAKTGTVIGKGKGIADNGTILIHDETVVLVLGNIDADEIGHKDTSL